MVVFLLPASAFELVVWGSGFTAGGVQACRDGHCPPGFIVHVFPLVPFVSFVVRRRSCLGAYQSLTDHDTDHSPARPRSLGSASRPPTHKTCVLWSSLFLPPVSSAPSHEYRDLESSESSFGSVESDRSYDRPSISTFPPNCKLFIYFVPIASTTNYWFHVHSKVTVDLRTGRTILPFFFSCCPT